MSVAKAPANTEINVASTRPTLGIGKLKNFANRLKKKIPTLKDLSEAANRLKKKLPTAKDLSEAAKAGAEAAAALNSAVDPPLRF